MKNNLKKKVTKKNHLSGSYISASVFVNTASLKFEQLLVRIIEKESKKIDHSAEFQEMHKLLKSNYEFLKESNVSSVRAGGLKNLRLQVVQMLKYLLFNRLLDAQIAGYWYKELKDVRPDQHPCYFDETTLILWKIEFLKTVPELAGNHKPSDDEVLKIYSHLSRGGKIIFLKEIYGQGMRDLAIRLGESLVKNSPLSQQPILGLLLIWNSYYEIYLNQPDPSKKMLIQGVKYLIAACEQKCDSSWSKEEINSYSNACEQLGRFYAAGLWHKGPIISIDFKKAELFLKKSQTDSAKLGLASIWMRVHDIEKARILLDELIKKDIYPENIHALLYLNELLVSGKLKTTSTELSAHFETILKKITGVKTTDINDRDSILYDHFHARAVQYYLRLYYQENQAKYADAARVHLQLTKLRGPEKTRPQLLIYKEILDSLESENSKNIFIHSGDCKKNQEIKYLLNQHKDIFKDLPDKIENIPKYENIFLEISEGILKINSYKEFKDFYQKTNWHLLLISLNYSFITSMRPKKGILFLKIISKLQLYPESSTDSLVAEIIKNILPVVFHEKKDLDYLTQCIYWLAKIGPVFLSEYFIAIMPMFEEIAYICKNIERDTPPKNACLLLYSISLLHAAVAQQGKNYESYLFYLAKLAKKVAEFISKCSNLSKLDLGQVQWAAFYFLRCLLPKNKDKKASKEIRNTFFGLLCDLTLLVKKEQDLDDDDEPLTSESQRRFYQKLALYFSEAREEEEIKFEAAGRTITHHLDIFIPKSAGGGEGARLNARGIEFDGPLHWQMLVKPGKSAEEKDVLHKTPKTLLRDALCEFYHPGKTITISGLDPEMPNLFAEETLETRIAWFRFLVLRLGCRPILFFMNLPVKEKGIKYQCAEPWRINVDSTEKRRSTQFAVASYLSYLELRTADQPTFFRLIKAQSIEYGFIDPPEEPAKPAAQPVSAPTK